MIPRAHRIAARVAAIGSVLTAEIAAGCWGFFVAAAMAADLGSDTLPSPAALEVFQSQVRPLLAQYCYSCHSGTDAEGGLALDAYQDGTKLVEDPARWRTIADRVSDGDMPPDGEERPDDAQLESLVTWIERQVAAVDRQHARDPGRVTMRRLNRVEYNNTIRDLVGLDFHPSDDFPADDVGYGFDNNGDVLSLPPLLMEKYLSAAQKIAEAAIVTPADPRVLADVDAIYTTHHGSGRAFGDSGWQFYGDGNLTIDIAVVAPGDHRILIRAFGQQAGPDPARMEVSVGGRSIGVVDVAATRTAAQTYEVPAHLASGKYTVSLAFINDFYDSAGPANRRDRNLMVESVRIESRGNAEGQTPETHRRIIFRDPTPDAEPAAAREILTAFASRAFRRPVQPAEVDRLVKLYDVARGQGDTFNEGIRLAVEAVLVSPQFLFRLELDPLAAGASAAAPDGAAASPAEAAASLGGVPAAGLSVRALGDYEIASRLSYFLWSSIPDDVLMAAAAAGRLHEPSDVAAQAKRMLADPKSQALVENFSGQWLELRRLERITPDKDLFPAYDAELAAAMRQETERFFAAVVAEDRSLLDFLNADFTFLNERLARHYGIDGVAGGEFRRVQLTDNERGGLLTQASILTLTSNPTRTSPVKRGKWVLENLLGATIPPPPPGAPPLPERTPEVAAVTLRQRLEQHLASAECATCHVRMDPIGLGLENYDAVGAWRLAEGGTPIDASGKVGGRAFDNPFEFRQRLRAKPAQFTRCLASKLLTYALGRGVEGFDRPTLTEIAERTEAAGWRFSGLVEAVVQSDPFLKCRMAGAMP